MKLLRQIAEEHWSHRPDLRGVAISRNDLQGCNKKFSVHLGGIEWLVKVSDGWAASDPRSVRDLNEREELFCILAKACNIPVVDCWRIETKHLQFQPGVSFKQNDIWQIATASRFVSAEKCPACAGGQFEKSQLLELSDLFAFCHWIGDEDRGLDDVLWVEGRPCLIDQSLSGPPSQKLTHGNECRGTHFERDDRVKFSHDQVVKKCPSGKTSLAAHLMRDHRVRLPWPSTLELIKQTDPSVLSTLVDHYSMSEQVTLQLLERLNTLDADFREWQYEAEKLLFMA